MERHSEAPSSFYDVGMSLTFAESASSNWDEFSDAVRFRRRADVRLGLWSLVPWLVAMAGSAAVLCWMIAEVTKGSHAMWIGLGIAVAVLIYMLKALELHLMNTRTFLGISAKGITFESPQLRTWARWEDIWGFEIGNPIAPSVRVTPAGVYEAGLPAATSDKNMKLAIGARGFAQRKKWMHPMLYVATVQFYGLWGTSPKPMDYLLFFPSEYELDWREKSIGEYLRLYRPDLAIPPVNPELPEQ